MFYLPRGGLGRVVVREDDGGVGVVGRGVGHLLVPSATWGITCTAIRNYGLVQFHALQVIPQVAEGEEEMTHAPSHDTDTTIILPHYDAPGTAPGQIKHPSI
jgi:hypothetical protein